MPFYRTPGGTSTMHLNFGGRRGPLPCAAPALENDNRAISAKCLRPSRVLCDAAVGTDLAGKPLTCDMPLCEHHATHVNGSDVDYCPRHASLAEGTRATR